MQVLGSVLESLTGSCIDLGLTKLEYLGLKTPLICLTLGGGLRFPSS